MVQNPSARGPRIDARCYVSHEALTQALAARLARSLASGAANQALMLSGGNTPLPAYRAVAARKPRAPAGLCLLYSDDRYVPATDAGSNYFQTRALVDALALPAERMLRVRTELPLAAAAADYDQRLAELEQRGVTIDLGLLGLGPDGHTASLFNAEHIAQAQGHRAIAVHRPDGRDAVSVTPSVLERVRELVFIVSGKDKLDAMSAFLGAATRSTAWHAVRGRSVVELWCDQDAWPADAGPAPVAANVS
jgi:6-phosphogluconolactonase